MPSAIQVDDDNALGCILTALRDGSSGMVRWKFDDLDGFGSFLDMRLWIQDDRTVFVMSVSGVEVDGEFSDVTRSYLRSADYFSDCLAADEERMKVLCLVNVVAETILVCEEGGATFRP